MHFDVGSGIRAFRLVLIGALLVVASAPAATAATAGFGSPAPGRPVLQWMPEEFATGHTYTQAQAVTAATRYDVIVAYTQAFQPYVAAMRAANPNLVLLAYMNGMFVPPAQATSWPADWYSYDANGLKVQNAQNKNYLMNPSNSGWVQNRATMCANLVAQSGYDGCMLDTLGVAPLTPGYCTALPINPATGAAWARPDWISATTQLSQSVRTTISPSLVVGNGLKDGPSLGESSQLFNGMDGGIAEGFLRTSTQSATTYPSVSTWQQNVNMLQSPPKPVLALTKVWASATTDQLNQWHLYALASFLLGTDGRSYFYFSSASSEPPISVDSLVGQHRRSFRRLRAPGRRVPASLHARACACQSNRQPGVRSAVGGVHRNGWHSGIRLARDAAQHRADPPSDIRLCAGCADGCVCDGWECVCDGEFLGAGE